MSRPRTLGELKALGHRYRSVKEELRENVIARLKARQPLFAGIVGYEHTVEPQIVNAVLSKHDFILLGLRGQAKTRMLRSLVQFLDEYVPAIEGCPLNSDPFMPLTHAARQSIDVHGDSTPIRWVHRDERYQEKLATPDVTIADIIVRDGFSAGDGGAGGRQRGLGADLLLSVRLPCLAQQDERKICVRSHHSSPPGANEGQITWLSLFLVFVPPRNRRMLLDFVAIVAFGGHGTRSDAVGSRRTDEPTPKKKLMSLRTVVHG